MGKTNTLDIYYHSLIPGIGYTSSTMSPILTFPSQLFTKSGAKFKKLPDGWKHMDKNRLRIRGVKGEWRELCKQTDGQHYRSAKWHVRKQHLWASKLLGVGVELGVAKYHWQLQNWSLLFLYVDWWGKKSFIFKKSMSWREMLSSVKKLYPC